MSGRLFVAIDLDERARDYVAAAIQRLEHAGLDARFTPREKWHATVAFLGPAAPEKRATIGERLQAAASRCAPFDLRLDAVGAFPNPRRPRVVWVGSSSPQQTYAACAEQVRAALSELGFAFDDEAVPHITVCRLKRSETPLPAVTLDGAAVLRVDHLTLYDSVSAGPSTRYVPVRTVFLAVKAGR